MLVSARHRPLIRRRRAEGERVAEERGLRAVRRAREDPGPAGDGEEHDDIPRRDAEGAEGRAGPCHVQPQRRRGVHRAEIERRVLLTLVPIRPRSR
eukprot:27332-Pelagococcus_subviridis.AAC.1